MMVAHNWPGSLFSNLTVSPVGILILSSLALIFFLDLNTPLGFAVWILYFIPIFLTLYINRKNAPYAIAGIIVVLMWLGFFFSPIDVSTAVAFLNRTFFVILITFLTLLVGHYRQNVEILRQSEEGVRMANKKLNLLSSITRHDILNQILVLNGFLSLIKNKTSEPEILNFLNRCDSATQNIERQINFTRDYQDMGVVAPMWHNVKRSITGTQSALPMGSVTVDIDHDNLEVFADPLFDKVFYNLIDNSLKYGGKDLHTIHVHSRENADTLSIIYEDDGAGISEQDRVHLFERGFGKHTGLGLFLIRAILDITGITIIENSVPGNGARFEMTVPEGMFRFSIPG